jgi:hypothetical protein
LGRKGIAPLILNFGTRWRLIVNFMPRLLYPREKTAVPIEEEVGWAPELVWTSGEEKIPFLLRDSNHGPSSK